MFCSLSAWVRGKRNDPPSHEEIMRREQMTVTVKKRAKELEAKDREVQQLKTPAAYPQASPKPQGIHDVLLQ